MTLSFNNFFFFNDTATTEIYTLSLHDALPISDAQGQQGRARDDGHRQLEREVLLGLADLREPVPHGRPLRRLDRKSTRLNSSHANISYAVFCLKKKKKKKRTQINHITVNSNN